MVFESENIIPCNKLNFSEYSRMHAPTVKAHLFNKTVKTLKRTACAMSNSCNPCGGGRLCDPEWAALSIKLKAESGWRSCFGTAPRVTLKLCGAEQDRTVSCSTQTKNKNSPTHVKTIFAHP